MRKIYRKGPEQAGATQNGILVAKCIVPRGTFLVGTEIDESESKVLFIFRVKWFAVPFYLIKAIYSMLKEGLIFNVFVDKIETERQIIELRKMINTIKEPERQVH